MGNLSGKKDKSRDNAEMNITRSLFLFILLFIASNTLIAQQNAILSGNVRDQDNKPLELVNVAMLGSTTGSVTDQKGNYVLVVPADQDITVDFSFIGYKSKRYQVNLQAGEQKRTECGADDIIYRVKGCRN